MGHPYTIIRGSDDRRTLTAYLDGEPIVVPGDHPNFEEIIQAVEDGFEASEIRDLADLSAAVGKRMQPLSERVKVAAGRVFFDGDEIDNALSQHILRVMDAGCEDWRPLVRFMENLAQNPQKHSREQLYDWLRDRDFTITEEGEIVAYKGVRRLGDGSLVSIHSGPAIVDDVPVNGNVPNTPGSTVEIERSSVAFDPAMGCSTGLHVGTWSYASSFARGAVLRCVVNPRDVVSVPTDCDAQKVRVCRYRVSEVIDTPDTDPIRVEDDPFYDPDFEDVDEGWF